MHSDLHNGRFAVLPLLHGFVASCQQSGYKHDFIHDQHMSPVTSNSIPDKRLLVSSPTKRVSWLFTELKRASDLDLHLQKFVRHSELVLQNLFTAEIQSLEIAAKAMPIAANWKVPYVQHN